nr:hypothetical protein [Ostreibacterium oceani]
MRDYDQCCLNLADQKELNQSLISLRYGELNFYFYEGNKYGYNDQLGLFKL